MILKRSKADLQRRLGDAEHWQGTVAHNPCVEKERRAVMGEVTLARASAGRFVRGQALIRRRPLCL
jgi:hypothetical protein